MSGNANANTSGAMQANTGASGAGMRRRSGRCDNTQQEQTDLSGTYTGNVNYPDGGLTGDGTLTITGNNFTLASGTQNITGRVVATTTCGYTAAAMMLGEPTTSTPGQPAPQPPTTVSVRVKRNGSGIWMTPVTGAAHPFTFSSGGGGGRARGGRRRGRRGGGMGAGDMSGGNANTGATGDTSGNSNMSGDMSGNANTSGDMSGNMNSNMNMRRPSRRRRGRRGSMNMNSNTGDTTNSNTGGNSNQ
jgi:hypothetical protein